VINPGNRAIELAEQRAEQERDAAVSRSIAALSSAGTPDCVDCREPIDPARKAALPSAERCIHCQSRRERRK
jgi:RNA polymerase-binding transcription factor DksA